MQYYFAYFNIEKYHATFRLDTDYPPAYALCKSFFMKVSKPAISPELAS